VATWNEISCDNLFAAGEMLRRGRFRSTISRAYYAAFSAATSLLVARGFQFVDGRDAPGHEQLPDLLMNNVGQLSVTRRRRAKRSLRSLYRARIEADYRLNVTIDRQMARDAVHEASSVLRELGVLQ